MKLLVELFFVRIGIVLAQLKLEIKTLLFWDLMILYGLMSWINIFELCTLRKIYRRLPVKSYISLREYSFESP